MLCQGGDVTKTGLIGLLAVAALFGSGVRPIGAEPRVVNIYNWSDYIAKDTLENFTKETGITVNYDTYGDNETLDAKLMTGRTGYDVVFPSASPFFAQQVKAGVFRPLDLAHLPNAKGLDPAIMANLASVDPGNVHGVPYMMSATGIGINVDKVRALLPDAPVDSWALLFDPRVTAVLKECGVTLLDTPTEVVPAALAYLGHDPKVQTREELAAAFSVLVPVRPNYRYLNSEKYRSDLATGDICVAHGYVGDLVQVRNRAKEANTGQQIGIVIPKEGAMVNIDVMAVPADAPHPDEATAFINYILRPDVVAAITNEVGYANAVLAASALVDPEILNDPVIYPPAAVRAKLFMALPPAARDYERSRARTWSRYRAGRVKLP